MALAIHCSSPEADFAFNFRHLPPGPDLRKDPRPGTTTSHGSHNAHALRNDSAARTDRSIAKYHSRQRRHKEQRWALDEEDGRDLAASNVPLPSYSGAAARGLKRQEAFFSEATCKRRLVRAQRETQTQDLSASDAELINLGILYNDEHLRGAGVTLNTITHDDSPTYVVRQARRRRAGPRQNQGRPVVTKLPTLPLELSFNELGQDAAIAAFLSGSYLGFDDEMSAMLMQPDTSELDINGEEDEATPRQNDFCFPAPSFKKSGARTPVKSGRSFAHLEVIYEAEDPNNSTEAEMQDADMEDEDGPTDTQVPDDDLCYDWASVSGLSMSSSQVELDFENDDGDEVRNGGRVVNIGDAAAVAKGDEMSAHKRVDAWVVLAGDS